MFQQSIVYLFLAINIVASTLYLFNQDNYREDWKSVSSYIGKDPSAKVMIIRPVSAPLWYYDKNVHELVDYGQREKIAHETELWLVKYAQPIFEPTNETEVILKTKYGFEEVEEKHFRGDIIVKYLVSSTGLTAYAKL